MAPLLTELKPNHNFVDLALMEPSEQLAQQIAALRMEVAELRRLVLMHVTDKTRHPNAKPSSSHGPLDHLYRSVGELERLLAA